MNVRSLLLSLLVLIGIGVAACSGGGTSAPTAPGTSTSVGIGAGSTVSGTASLKIPSASTLASSSVRRGQYISTATGSVGVTANGGSAVFTNVGTGSTACTATTSGRTCTIPLTALAGPNTFVFTLYDGPNGTGNSLGSGSVTQTLAPAAPFTVAVTVGGTWKTNQVLVTPLILPIGTAGTATVTATAKDADGYIIIGPGNYTNPITLTDSDTTGAVTLPAAASITAPGGSVTLTYSGSASVSPGLVAITGGSSNGTGAQGLTLAGGSGYTYAPSPGQSPSGSSGTFGSGSCLYNATMTINSANFAISNNTVTSASIASTYAETQVSGPTTCPTPIPSTPESYTLNPSGTSYANPNLTIVYTSSTTNNPSNFAVSLNTSLQNSTVFSGGGLTFNRIGGSNLYQITVSGTWSNVTPSVAGGVLALTNEAPTSIVHLGTSGLTFVGTPTVAVTCTVTGGTPITTPSGGSIVQVSYGATGQSAIAITGGGSGVTEDLPFTASLAATIPSGDTVSCPVTVSGFQNAVSQAVTSGFTITAAP